jgi:GNAT superfamily N-acetyltransferase
MGFSDLEATDVSISQSASESERFGVQTVRIIVGMKALNNPANAIGQVNQTLDRMASGLAIVRYPTRFTKLAGSLGLRDENLFPSGSLMYWEAGDGRRLAPKEPRDLAVFETDHRADIAEARRVLFDSFTGYLTHYSANPGLDSSLVAEGYAEWATGTLSTPANKLFLLRDGGVAVGAAVVAVRGDMWEIELAGVAAAAQGKGCYPILLDAVVDASRLVQSRLVISTQAHNTRVQKIWAQAGFVPINSFDTVHLARQSDSKARD